MRNYEAGGLGLAFTSPKKFFPLGTFRATLSKSKMSTLESPLLK
jgi:hypothetical protein